MGYMVYRGYIGYKGYMGLMGSHEVSSVFAMVRVRWSKSPLLVNINTFSRAQVLADPNPNPNPTRI